MTLRDWLAGRGLPTTKVVLPDDAEAYAAAERQVDAAARALVVEQSRSADVGAEREALAAAERALAAQPVRTVVLRALPATAEPPELGWEELVEQHPPTREERAMGAGWHFPTFRPALLAASVLADEGEEPLTAAEWDLAIRTGRVTLGEVNRLFDEAVTLNGRSPEVSTGKG